MAPRHTGESKGLVGFLFSHKIGDVAVLLFLLLLIYLFPIRGIRFFEVPSSSMEPTFLVGDRIVTLRQKVYRRGDIVVLRDTEEGGYIVKRITGLPGDELSVRGGALFINGGFASEPYVQERMEYTFPGPGFVTVPRGRVFLLGDNRNASNDSSMRLETWPTNDIVGRVRHIYFPYSRARAVASYPLKNERGE